MTLHLWTCFHANLGYSSIEVEQRPAVADSCYRPLVDLAARYPLGLEAPSWSLAQLAEISPGLLADWRAAVNGGPSEAIGSGYQQIIAPLVPAVVNAANLTYGGVDYERLLGVRPTVALANEGAWADGLAVLYQGMGYRAVIAAAAKGNRWLRAGPQRYDWGRVAGSELSALLLDTVTSQQVQRYVHGDLELDDVLAYLARHADGSEDRVLCLYGLDVEAIGFRPGRYHAEAPQRDDEWLRLERLLEAVAADERYRLCTPSQALEAPAGAPVGLTSPREPVAVKKQPKYALGRWAVTGRGSLRANAACRRILAARGRADRELLDLWASDYRTHTTQARWEAFSARLAALDPEVRRTVCPPAGESHRSVVAQRAGRFLEVVTPHLRARLDLRRGLTLNALVAPGLGTILGTVPHGYWLHDGHADLEADWYSGHATIERPGEWQETDLDVLEGDPVIARYADRIVVAAPTRIAHKTVTLFAGEPVAEVTWRWRVDWPAPASARVHLTLPALAWRQPLEVRAHQGGPEPDVFVLDDEAVDHGEWVSPRVSAASGLGMTEGSLVVRDDMRELCVEADQPVLGLVTFRPLPGGFFGRLSFSLAEVDDTPHPARLRLPPLTLRLTARRTTP